MTLQNNFEGIELATPQTIVSTLNLDEINQKHSHIQIINNHTYMGSIAIDFLRENDTSKTLADYQSEWNYVSVRKDSHWFEVYEVCSRFLAKNIAVIGEHHTFIETLYFEDFFKDSYKLPLFSEIGHTLIITKSIQDYSISEITQIVESKNSRILGLFISNYTPHSIEITLKISPVNVHLIIRDLRRYGYLLLSDSIDDEWLNELKENSQYFDKFLTL